MLDRVACGGCPAGGGRPWTGGIDGAQPVQARGVMTSHANTTPRVAVLGSFGARRAVILALVVLATVVALGSVLAVWVQREALNTDVYVQTSAELLEDPAVRTAVTNYAVDELYRRVDVAAELEKVLPKDADRFSELAAAGLRQGAYRALDQALGTAVFASIWQRANRRAHEQFVNVVNGGGAGISTEGGVVRLELRPILEEATSRIGLGESLAARVPADAGSIEIMRSNALGTVQNALRLLDTVAKFLPLVALGLYAAATWQARRRRRETVRDIGVGLVVGGGLVLLLVGVTGDVVLDRLVTEPDARDAAAASWRILTAPLNGALWAVIALGAIVALGAVLAGPGRRATAMRRRLSPYLEWRGFAIGTGTVFLLALLLSGAIDSFERFSWLVMFTVLVGFGTESLRRQTTREFPEAELPAVGSWLRSRWGHVRARGRNAAAAARAERHPRWAGLGLLSSSSARACARLQSARGSTRRAACPRVRACSSPPPCRQPAWPRVQQVVGVANARTRRQPRRLAVERDLWRRAEDDFPAQRLVAEVALHLGGCRQGHGAGQEEGESTAKHGVDPVAVRGPGGPGAMSAKFSRRGWPSCTLMIRRSMAPCTTVHEYARPIEDTSMHTQFSHPEHEKAWSMPIEQIDVSKGYLFEHDYIGWYFERLRQQDPVHHAVSKRYGPYWSVTRYEDIMAVDTNHSASPPDAHAGRHRPRRRWPTRTSQASSPWTRRATTSSARPSPRSSRPATSRTARADDPRTRGRILDSLPARRGVRLGRPGVDRADHADAGDPVRLPVRGTAASSPAGRTSPPACPIRHRPRSARSRCARPSCGKCPDYFTGLWNERATPHPAPT